MTPTEQAIELVKEFYNKMATYNHFYDWDIAVNKKGASFEIARSCALLCVGQIMKTHPAIDYEKPRDFWDSGTIKINASRNYWLSVYESIKSL